MAPVPSPVPLAVWAIAQTDPDLPAHHRRSDCLRWSLARRIVEEYAPPGSLVLASRRECATALVAAAVAGRRCRALESLTAAPADCGDGATMPETAAALVLCSPQRLLAPPRRQRHQVAARRRRHDRPRLSHLGNCSARQPTALTVAARLLGPGGLVVAVCRSEAGEGRLFDPIPDLVEQAHAAGLYYLQHVIALGATIGEDGFEDLGPAPSSAPPWTRHRRVHVDVVVFHKPEAG